MKKLVLFCMLTIFVLTCTFGVYADQLTSAKQQKSSIDSQINSVAKEKQKIMSDQKKMQSEQQNIQAAQKQEGDEYTSLLNEVKAIQEELDKLDASVKESEENYQKQRELLKTRLRAMSETSGNTMVETLLRAKSFTDFFNRLELISLISKKDRQIMDALRIAKLDMEEKRQFKDQEKTEVTQKIGEKQERITELKASRADLEDKIRKSQADLKRLESQEDALYQKSKEMDSLIKSLSGKTKYIGGNMLWPCPGRTNVTSPYGMRMHPILKKNKMHTGIDIDARTGDNIVAANDGKVILAKWQSGYGNTVVIDHGGGITTLYGHASKILVKAGDSVKAGDVIAKVGSTGLSTGPHLHFEVRKDGETRNPLEPIK